MSQLPDGFCLTTRRDFLLASCLAAGVGVVGNRTLAAGLMATGFDGNVGQGAAATDAADDTGPRYATPTTFDRAGRIVAPVRIGTHSLRFILDTGANRSAMAATTAARIGAASAGEALVHGITGSAVMPEVEVPELLLGELRFERHRLAVLPDAIFAGVDGIVGIDTLQEARIDVDFGHDGVIVRRSSRERPKGWLVVRATVRHRGLLLIPGHVGRVPVKAIVDTGAERSLGNESLFAELSRRTADAQAARPSMVVGATAQVVRGRSFVTPPVSLGGDTHIGNLTVTFGDFHVFGVWDLLAKPALVLGMDVLGTLPEFSIDYPRRQFLFKVDRRLPPVAIVPP